MLKSVVSALLDRPALLAGSALLLSMIPGGLPVAMMLMALAIMRLGIGGLPVTLLLGLMTWFPIHMGSSGLPLLMWLQTLVMALCHRRYARWGDTLMAGMVLTVSIILLFPGVWLRPGPELAQALAILHSQETLSAMLGRQPNEEATLLWVSGLIGSTGFIVMILAMLAARALQASLFNPTGFGLEFRELRLSPVLATVVIIMAIVLVGRHQYPLAAAPLFVPAVAGIALTHTLVRQRGLSTLWLCGFYAFVVLIPIGIIIVLLLGITDAFVDIRNRLPRSQH